MPENRTEIEYTIGKDDILAFNRFHTRHSAAWKRQYREQQIVSSALIFFICFALALIACVIRPETPLAVAAPLGILIAAVAIFFNLLFYRYQVNSSQKKLVNEMIDEGRNRGMLGRHKLIVEDEYLVEITEVAEGRTMWIGVERVEQDDDYIAIYIGYATAHVIPKRSFRDEEAAQDFFNLVRERIDAASAREEGKDATKQAQDV